MSPAVIRIATRFSLELRLSNALLQRLTIRTLRNQASHRSIRKWKGSGLRLYH